MRLIDADALEAVMRVAINGMKMTAKLFGISDDGEVSATLKAYEDILDGIKEQPTVEADDGWIPVSEHLPKKNDFYIVTLNNRNTDFCFWNGNEFGTYFPKWNPCDEVTAWQQLPKPYRPKEDK